MTEFSSALVTRAASLRDNPQYLEIFIPTRSFHAHKIILSARSSDWGRGVDLRTMSRRTARRGTSRAPARCCR